jgi:carbohydrate kinase (thermoresistant glucokinase family)
MALASKDRWVIMGVSGCGKSTVGAALAQVFDIPYLEGDAYHPAANVAKMAAGIPLDDADRAGWLQGLADEIRQARERGAGLVLSCSALKRRYRDLLRQADPSLRFVHLQGPRALIAERMQARVGHYMPSSLLESQLSILEPLQADEGSLTLDITQPPQVLVARITEST